MLAEYQNQIITIGTIIIGLISTRAFSFIKNKLSVIVADLLASKLFNKLGQDNVTLIFDKLKEIGSAEIINKITDSLKKLETSTQTNQQLFLLLTTMAQNQIDMGIYDENQEAKLLIESILENVK